MTCSDTTYRKDLYAGKYVKNGSPVGYFPAVRNVAGIDGCFAYCRDEPGCSAFTSYSGIVCNLFITDSTRCGTFLGGGSGYFNGLFSQIGTDLGYRTCSDSTCRKDLTSGSWYNCAGTPFPGYQVANDQACVTECLKEPGCNYATFYPGGACNLFITNGATCVEGYSQAPGNWYRYGSSSAVSPLTEEDANSLETTEEKQNDPHEGMIVGLSVGLGVAAFLVLALSVVVVVLLFKWGKSSSAEEKSVQLL